MLRGSGGQEQEEMVQELKVLVGIPDWTRDRHCDANTPGQMDRWRYRWRDKRCGRSGNGPVSQWRTYTD